MAQTKWWSTDGYWGEGLVPLSGLWVVNTHKKKRKSRIIVPKPLQQEMLSIPMTKHIYATGMKINSWL